MTNTKIFANEILTDEQLDNVNGGTCAQLHELTKALTSNNAILKFCAGAAELATKYKAGCIANIPLSYAMEGLLGDLGVKAYVSVGWLGTGANEVENSYKNKVTGASYSHAEVLDRVKNYGKFALS